jgi:hypothetical protein
MTTKTDDELSTFALDVYWASGRGDPTLEEHVTACARCLAYLARLEELAQSGPRVPVPAAHVPVRDATERPKRRWALPSALGAGLALAAGLVLLVRGRPVEPRYVGLKGTPAVQVLVHRQADTWIWDGRTAIRPGDALALRVACEGLDHVAVASPGAAGWGRITDVECPVEGAPLPFTLVVDGAPGDEQLAVVLSRDALDDDSLRGAIGESRRTADVWVAGFVLPKETGNER